MHTTSTIILAAIALGSVSLAAPANHQLVGRDTQRASVIVFAPTDEADYYSFDLNDDGKTWSCWKPVKGKWADLKGKEEYDLKPTEIYGKTDCTYNFINNDQTQGTAGILNCPSGPTDISCARIDTSSPPGEGLLGGLTMDGLNKHTCKPEGTSNAVPNGFCQWQ